LRITRFINSSVEVILSLFVLTRISKKNQVVLGDLKKTLSNPIKEILDKQHDKYLFKQIKQGKEQAFDVLFRKYFSRLCRIAYYYTHDAFLSEEIAQEVFLTLWKEKVQIEIKKGVDMYLFQMVRNKAITKINYQQKNKTEDINGVINVMDEYKQSDDPKALKIAISKAVDTLPVRCREVFVLHKTEGLTYNEIAAYLEVSVKTVENQMVIAFKKLQKLLLPHYEELISN